MDIMSSDNDSRTIENVYVPENNNSIVDGALLECSMSILVKHVHIPF